MVRFRIFVKADFRLMPYFRQYRIILSADTASEKYKLLSKKRR